MSTPAIPLDACLVCPDPPFDREACPATAVQAANGGTITAHECPVCGSSWRTWRDGAGWPVVRVLDPVTPAQAMVNRTMLALALDEHARERRYAA